MNLWVQPVDESSRTSSSSDGIPEVDVESGRPIIQLNVEIKHVLLGKVIKSPRDAFTSRKPCEFHRLVCMCIDCIDIQKGSIHYTITRSASSETIVRRRLKGAMRRKYRPLTYPAGVGPENIREFLENVGFGSPQNIPDLSKFVKPDAGIRALRNMAKRSPRAKVQTPETWQIWQQPVFPDSNYHLSFETKSS